MDPSPLSGGACDGAVLQAIAARAPGHKTGPQEKEGAPPMSSSAVIVVLVGTNRLFRQGLRRLLDPEQFVETYQLHTWQQIPIVELRT
jgi:hypothetical protein